MPRYSSGELSLTTDSKAHNNEIPPLEPHRFPLVSVYVSTTSAYFFVPTDWSTCHVRAHVENVFCDSRGTKLLFPTSSAEPTLSRKLIEKTTLSPPKTVSLLDDLLEAPDTVVTTPLEPAVELTKICDQPVCARPAAVDHFAGLHSTPETKQSASPFDNIVFLADPNQAFKKEPVEIPPTNIDAPDLFAPDVLGSSEGSSFNQALGAGHSLKNSLDATKMDTAHGNLADRAAEAFGNPEMATFPSLHQVHRRKQLDCTTADLQVTPQSVDYHVGAINKGLTHKVDKLPMGVIYSAAAGDSMSKNGEIPDNKLSNIVQRDSTDRGVSGFKDCPAQEEEEEWMSAGRSSFTDSDAEATETLPSGIVPAESAPVISSHAPREARRLSAGSADGSTLGGGISRQDEEADKLFGQMMAREQTRWEGNEEFFKALQKEARIADMDTLI